MAQFLMILSFLKAVAPMILQLIETVDVAMPAGTPGKTKLDTFQALLREGVQMEASLAPTFDAAWPLVAQVVSAVVSAKKAVPAAA